MFSVRIDGEEVGVSTWKFPAGEVGVKLDMSRVGVQIPKSLYITWKWEGDSDLMLLAQIVDAAMHEFPSISYKCLEAPYFPYSRQDRRCFSGEGHALKMMASFINSLGFSRVVTKDAHSYVLEAVVDNLYNVEQYVCAQHLPKHDVLVAPDNGASKKIYKVAQRMSADVVIADKRRDNAGKIVDVSVNTSLISPSSSVCVVDDLCDGGATFVELGKELRRTLKNNTINLYVTHGFFGKGVDELLKLYDNVYVHNLMNKDVEHSVKII